MELPVTRSLRHWWVFLLRGILFVLLGIYMIASPLSSYVALGFIFGLIILLTGVGELFHVVRDNTAANRGWHLFLGILDIIIGLILMSHLAASADILRIIVGIWFVFRGFSLLSFSRLAGKNLFLTIGGVLTIIFGLFVIFNAVFGALTIIIWTAIAFIITGLFNVYLGIRLKNLYP